MNEDRSQTPVPSPGLREEAAAWFAKMRGDDAEDYRVAFEEWLALGAMHRAAYNRIGEIFAAGKALKPHGSIGARNGMRHVALVSIGALVLAGAGATWWHAVTSGVPHDASARLVRIAGSPARPIDLAPGERVFLDVDGVVSPSVGGNTRLIRLEQGRARFETATNRAGWQILAGNSEIRSNGATFDLWLRPDGALDAAVLAGTVELRPATFMRFSRSVQAVTLQAGRTYRVDAKGRPVERRGSVGTDWAQGILEFRGTPLADVLAEANRYSAVKIVLAEPSLGTLRISGRFTLDGPRQLAQRLALALSLDLDTRRDGVIVMRSR